MLLLYVDVCEWRYMPWRLSIYSMHCLNCTVWHYCVCDCWEAENVL